MGRASFTEGHLIDARLLPTESLLRSNRERLSPNLTIDETSHSRNVSQGDRTDSCMMQLIAGSMVGYTDYHDIYSSIGNTETNSDSDKETSSSSVPTLVDEKQYVTYEIMCCTFLLGLVNQSNNPNSLLSLYLNQAILSTDSESDTEELVAELKVRGGQDQLIMFLTGPAGAGKSTAMKVARRFCFEFSLAVGALWSDRMFLFIAYTGSAAMLVGGLTICKAAYLMKKGALTEEDKR